MRTLGAIPFIVVAAGFVYAMFHVEEDPPDTPSFLPEAPSIVAGGENKRRAATMLQNHEISYDAALAVFVDNSTREQIEAVKNSHGCETDEAACAMMLRLFLGDSPEKRRSESHD